MQSLQAVGPKMDGGPNTKYFESPDTINSLENVKNWLQKNAKKVGKLKNLYSKIVLT